MDISSCTPQAWLKNEANWTEKLQDTTFWESIPLINVNDASKLKNNTLVRFHGMIQDMYDPEYYFDKYEIENTDTNMKYIKCGKYTDTTDLTANEKINFDSPKNVTCERQTVVAITLPGLNTWAQEIEINQSKVLNETELSPNKSMKRKIDEEEMDTESAPNTSDDSSKKIRTNIGIACSSNSWNAVVSQEHILNFPLPERTGKCCHLKVYQDAEFIKLNAMLEAVGFLSADPALSDVSYYNKDFENAMETQTHHPPASLVPRIHCVAIRPLENYNPLIKQLSVPIETFAHLRNELSIVLCQLLLGDKLATDYLICHLISNIYLRKEVLALGKFTVNISNIPSSQQPTYVEDIYDFIQALLPKSHYIAMTLDNMNDSTFIPKKDYECNRLTSGLLQLSDNTHVVLDETKLEPGQLNNSACKGLAAISNIINTQRAQYDFQYYQMDFDCDIPFLIFSEGKSLLPSDYHVPLEPDEHNINTFQEIKSAAKHFLKSELLNNLRVYLTQARFAKYEISDTVLELVQNEFVQMRATSEKVSADDLHHLLVLARLLCLSYGKSSLDEDCWKEVCKMEQERKARIAERTQRK